MNIKRLWKEYRRLSARAQRESEKGEAGLRRLLSEASREKRLAALCHNDLGVLLAIRGETDSAHAEFIAALDVDSSCEAARANLLRLSPALQQDSAPFDLSTERPPKIAIVSMPFNWPAASGGICETVGNEEEPATLVDAR